MQKDYNKEYNSKSIKVLYPPNIITKLFLSRFSPITKKFKNKKILDFSCGAGPYLKLFLDLKFQIYATETSDKIIRLLKQKYKKIKFSVGNNNKLDFKSKFFDIIFCHHSIYYLDKRTDNFFHTINLMYNKLKFGGYLICTFPKIKQTHLKFKFIKKNIYKISFDRYKIRKGWYLYLFKKSYEIKNFFKSQFKVINIGSCKTEFKNLDEDYFIVVLQKK
jgi:SAM-dependent methyltransferase